MEEEQKHSSEDVSPTTSSEFSNKPLTEEAAAGTSDSSSWASWGMNLLQSAKEKSAEAIGTVRKDIGSLTQTAKEKSAEVMGYVRKDFDELARTVSDEVHSTTATLKEKLKIEEAGNSVKKGMSSFFSHVSDIFYILPDDDSEPIFFNQCQAKIYSIACDPATFLVDPVHEEFKHWQESFVHQRHEAEIEHFLSDNEKLKENFEKLVPAEVSEEIFWCRFLFHVYLIHQEEAQRQAERKEAERQEQEERVTEAEASPEDTGKEIPNAEVPAPEDKKDDKTE